MATTEATTKRGGGRIHPHPSPETWPSSNFRVTSPRPVEDFKLGDRAFNWLCKLNLPSPKRRRPLVKQKQKRNKKKLPSWVKNPGAVHRFLCTSRSRSHCIYCQVAFHCRRNGQEVNYYPCTRARRMGPRSFSFLSDSFSAGRSQTFHAFGRFYLFSGEGKGDVFFFGTFPLREKYGDKTSVFSNWFKHSIFTYRKILQSTNYSSPRLILL